MKTTTFLTLLGGDTYGPELVTNGNMETGSPPTGWAAWADTPTVTSVTDGQTGAIGTKALDVAVAVGQTAGTVNYDLGTALKTGKRYRLSWWYKNINSTQLVVVFYRADYGANATIGGTKNLTAWTNETVIYTPTFDVAHIILIFYGTAAQHGRINDVSIRELRA